MCSEKCCFFIPLSLSSFIIGAVNLLSSVILTILAIYFLLYKEPDASFDRKHLKNIFDVFELSKIDFEVIIWIVLVFELLHLIFTIQFIIGLLKNKSNLILSFFGFSCMATMLIMIGALLELIHNFWISSLGNFLVSLLNLHLSSVVYNIYENMLNGKKFQLTGHCTQSNDDEAPILNEFDDVSA